MQGGFKQSSRELDILFCSLILRPCSNNFLAHPFEPIQNITKHINAWFLFWLLLLFFFVAAAVLDVVVVVSCS